jgi:hypothetical protein
MGSFTYVLVVKNSWLARSRKSSLFENLGLVECPKCLLLKLIANRNDRKKKHIVSVFSTPKLLFDPSYPSVTYTSQPTTPILTCRINICLMSMTIERYAHCVLSFHFYIPKADGHIISPSWQIEPRY